MQNELEQPTTEVDPSYFDGGLVHNVEMTYYTTGVSKDGYDVARVDVLVSADAELQPDDDGISQVVPKAPYYVLSSSFCIGLQSQRIAWLSVFNNAE